MSSLGVFVTKKKNLICISHKTTEYDPQKRQNKNQVMTKMFSRFLDLRCLSQPCMRRAKDLQCIGRPLDYSPIQNGEPLTFSKITSVMVSRS